MALALGARAMSRDALLDTIEDLAVRLRHAEAQRDDLLHNDLLVRRLRIFEAALQRIAGYKLVGTEMTLHHDFISIAKEALGLATNERGGGPADNPR